MPKISGLVAKIILSSLKFTLKLLFWLVFSVIWYFLMGFTLISMIMLLLDVQVFYFPSVVREVFFVWDIIILAVLFPVMLGLKIDPTPSPVSVENEVLPLSDFYSKFLRLLQLLVLLLYIGHLLMMGRLFLISDLLDGWFVASPLFIGFIITSIMYLGFKYSIKFGYHKFKVLFILIALGVFGLSLDASMNSWKHIESIEIPKNSSK